MLNKLVNLLLGVFFLCFQLAAYSSANIPDKSSIFDLGELGFHAVDDQNEIPTGVITVITQDSFGFLWFGTQKGLVRYDGYRFRLFEHNEQDPASLAGNYVSAIWAGHDGRVWAGTASDGISIYDPGTEGFSHIRYVNDSSGSAMNAIWMLTGDKHGNVLVATNEGLYHIHAISHHISQIVQVAGGDTVLDTQRFRSVIITDRDLWIGTITGLCRVVLPLNYLEDPNFNWSASLAGSEITDFSGQLVYSLFEANDAKIWVGTRFDGAAFIEPDNNRVLRINKRNVSPALPEYKWGPVINQPKNNEIWIGTTTEGILIVDPQSGQLIRQITHDPTNKTSIGVNNINLIFLDDSGFIWIGTWGSGMYFHNPNNSAIRMLKHSPYKPQSISHNNIYSLLELRNGDFWVGNKQTGIDVIDVQSGVIRKIKPEPDDPMGLAGIEMSALRQTNNGDIWVGTKTAGCSFTMPIQEVLPHLVWMMVCLIITCRVCKNHLQNSG